MSDPVGDLHIDDFCKDTAKTLLMLFRRFPMKTTLYVEDISGPDDPDEFGLHSPRFDACFSTFIWLKDADYIHYSSLVKQEAVEDATLTHRAFSLLTGYDNDYPDAEPLTPAGPVPGRSHPIRRIDHLKQALTEATSEDLKNLVLRYMLESRDFT